MCPGSKKVNNGEKWTEGQNLHFFSTDHIKNFICALVVQCGNNVVLNPFQIKVSFLTL